MLTPASARPLFTGPNIRTEEEIYGALSGHVLWRNLRELDRVLHQKGIRFSLLDNEKMCTELVSQYISVKRRQIL
jgi:hypothetical protein